MKRSFRTAFIHGRPQGHPIHALYAKSINADFAFEDRYVRWQDQADAGKLKRYLSWVVNALFFPRRREYDVFLTECIRVPQLIMKCVGLLSRKKLVALMADESLYFLTVGRYPVYSARLMNLFLRKCDALICIGDLETMLAKQLLGPQHHSKIFTIYNAVPAAKKEKLRSVQYNVKSRTLLFIGHASTEWRAWYKGLDVIFESFSIAAKEDSRLNLIVVGEISAIIQRSLCNGIDESVRNRIKFTGPTNDVVGYIEESGLYLHCSRGDAYPTTVLESMAAGLVPLLSDQTGVSELVQKVNSNFVAPLDSQIFAQRILDFFNLSDDLKMSYSSHCRKLTDAWSEEQSIELFKETFMRAVAHSQK